MRHVPTTPARSYSRINLQIDTNAWSILDSGEGIQTLGQGSAEMTTMDGFL
jgi:hypothetical protein